MRNYLHHPLFIVLFFSIVGFLLRVYNISWGAPYFFHPDERNIASAITQLSFPNNLNPHFFAYGSLPIYTVYFTGVFINIIRNTLQPTYVSFEQALLIGRVFSVILSVGLIPLVYVIGKKLKNISVGLFAALFTTTSIGLIQYAHFSTFELWLTFFGALLFYYCLLFFHHKTTKLALNIGLIFGVLMGIKVSSSVLLIPLGILFITSSYHKKNIVKSIKTCMLFFSVFLFSAFCIFIFTNPFVLLSSQEFLASMHYESSVVLGTLPVFYIQGFYNTIPVIYQLLHIFPFILNPLLLIIFLFSFFYVLYTCIRAKSFPFLFLILFFLTLFSSQAFFYAKWTRYMIPTLPFIYLITAFAVNSFFSYIKPRWDNTFDTIFFYSIGVICFFYAFCFVYVVYYQSDSRTQAKEWAKNHIAPHEKILSEVYDLGIVPFNDTYTNIELINFYDLEENRDEQTKLETSLRNTSFLVFPSQRIVKTRLQYPSVFPQGHDFYNKVFSEKGYKKVYETPCDIFCSILYMENPVFAFEETANVFDKPIVTIFKKL